MTGDGELMYKNFNLVNAMRNAIIVGTPFGEFVSGYQGKLTIQELKKIWNCAMDLLNNDDWKMFLEKVAIASLREFAETLQNVSKKGLSDQEIIDCLDFDEDILEKLLQPC